MIVEISVETLGDCNFCSVTHAKIIIQSIYLIDK